LSAGISERYQGTWKFHAPRTNNRRLQEAPPTQSGERLNVKTALMGLFVVLTIVFASTTVYESGIRTTLTSTKHGDQRVNDYQHDDPDDNGNFNV
jgi:hypothetical protein